MLACVVEVRAKNDDFRAKVSIAATFTGLAPSGTTIARDAEKLRLICDGLAVVAGRRRDQTALPFVLAQLRDQVHAPAHLESPRRLVVLVLHPHIGP